MRSTISIHEAIEITSLIAHSPHWHRINTSVAPPRLAPSAKNSIWESNLIIWWWSKSSKMYGNMNEARWHLNQHLRSSYFIFTPFRLQKSAKNLTKLKLTYLIDSKDPSKTINFNLNLNRQLFPVFFFKKCYLDAKIFNRNADFSNRTSWNEHGPLSV